MGDHFLAMEPVLDHPAQDLPFQKALAGQSGSWGGLLFLGECLPACLHVRVRRGLVGRVDVWGGGGWLTVAQYT